MAFIFSWNILTILMIHLQQNASKWCTLRGELRMGMSMLDKPIDKV